MSEPAALAMRVWTALDPSTPVTTGELAARMSEDAERVNYAIANMVRTLRAVRAEGGGFVRGALPPRSLARQKAQPLTAAQAAVLDRCSSVYGATMGALGKACGLGPKKASAVAQNLRRRGLLDMSGSRFAARYWTTEAGHDASALSAGAA